MPLNKINDDLKERIKLEVGNILSPYIYRYSENLNRIVALIELYPRLTETKDVTSAGQDILRACIVFLHATVEDLLRTVEAKYLPLANEIVLNNIPLYVDDESLTKFSLGKLTHFKSVLGN